LKKSGKIAAALWDPPPNTRWSPAAESSVLRPSSCYSHFTYVLLLSTAQISRYR